MTRRHWYRLLVFVLMLAIARPGVAAGAALRVMTFNVRVPVDTGMNAWTNGAASEGE